MVLLSRLIQKAREVSTLRQVYIGKMSIYSFNYSSWAPPQGFNRNKWAKFNSGKVASLAFARIQGEATLLIHFQNLSLMNEDEWCRPIVFQSEGQENADEVISLLMLSFWAF